RIKPGARVLEIGTGSGYGAAVLAKIAREVYTIEIIESLGKRASSVLESLGFDNVFVRVGDGYQGWPDKGPFDAIIVTAAPPRVPEPLKQQLKVGGRLVIPVGTRIQHLRVILRTKDGFREEPLFRVRFVPMTGEAQK
ncbi:MAG: methyltransferase domain-containing protein, partial [Planctomycetota bacterium]|nr:methyltransferase domain-containing protein [Planctomycetota bacterium]